jgi:hypothetical protein
MSWRGWRRPQAGRRREARRRANQTRERGTKRSEATMTQYETFESESFPGEFEDEQPSGFETDFGEFEQFEDEEEVRRGGGGGARPRAGGGRPANGTRWSTGRRIARPTSGDDAPRSRLAQTTLWRRGARPGRSRPGGRPSGCGPGARRPSGTRSGGARPGWAGPSVARPSLAWSPMAASVLAGRWHLRLWRGACRHAG